MFPISILPTSRANVPVPMQPTAALPSSSQVPRSLPTPFPFLPPPPQRRLPRPQTRPRLQQAPEPVRSHLYPEGSPLGPALALPAAQRSPPRRQRGEGRARLACHGGRLTVRLRSRARLRHGQAASLGKQGRAGKRRPGLQRAQLAEEASTEPPPPPPPPREEPLRLEPPAPPQPRAETDPSADLRLLILTAGNKRCAGAGGRGGT